MVRNKDAIAGLLVLSALFVPYAAQAEEAVASAPQQPKIPSIVVTKAETRPLVDRIVATGTIKPVEEIYVQPLVEGLSIKTLEADVGDKVEADGVVARLNDDALRLQKGQLQASRAKAEAALAQYHAQLTDAKTTADEADRQFKRATALGKSGTFSTSSVEQAETAATSARAKVTSAEQAIAIAEADIKVVDAQIADINLSLARTDVKSPFAGVVSVRNAKTGAIASGSGQPMFTIIRDGQIELVADVSETDILKMRVGQKAKITVAGGAASLNGSVRLISPIVDPQTRLGAVHIAIDDDNGARAGMYGNAEIIVAEANAVALPLSAITTSKHTTTTRLVNDGIIKQVDIATGIQDGAYIQVVSGLKAGDVVVAKAGAFVRDGDHINPINDETAASN
ncbi:efflux RND transporter periplasmic adaptor subunit [Rhizobium sp. S95]|uniref:Efflux RND transporter periplasmic adaptor subunit n=1 Tax=Ciceribacter sichuanensis TaxID=2949647 RepID=A0AAJ1BWE8_9HYPH|nr:MULTISPECIES: efflux RND transporter periplasmic adaptor subunit [unclassified Ciceribacter]MCM2398687.1 efflux RND transporter periplasmic adaptor subunit [Ciceribacter sp. S95]MCO5957107.1 efflux RND transporter periplasmic adaptor subunit [Ciceribacter sp. S101]